MAVTEIPAKRMMAGNEPTPVASCINKDYLIAAFRWLI